MAECLTDAIAHPASPAAPAAIRGWPDGLWPDTPLDKGGAAGEAG
jgi:hypothetical protein